MSLPSHGANPAHLYKASGVQEPERILDFSVNTNPFGSPDWLQQKWASFLHTIDQYPDPSGQKAVSAIARRFHLADGQVLLGNGAAEIIHFIARYAAGQKAVIVAPAFSEYEDACKAYGCLIEHVITDIHHWRLPVDILAEKAKDAAVLFICTPNNPTGQVFQEADIISLLERTKNSKAIIVIDEAFYDFAGDYSLVRFIDLFPHLAVMHSLTKMYAVAGLRIGYAAASATIIAKLQAYRPHWNVNSVALQVAEMIAQDFEYAPETRKRVDVERIRMKQALFKLGFQVLPSAVNFYLLKDPSLDNQRPLLEFLLQRGIVLRHTENFHGLDGKWLRSAVKQEVENNQLLAALQEWKRVC